MRTLIWRGSSEITRLREALALAVEDWRVVWGVTAAATVAVTAESASEAAHRVPDDPLRIVCAQPSVQLDARDDDVALAGLLLNDAHAFDAAALERSVFRDVVRRAYADMLQRLLGVEIALEADFTPWQRPAAQPITPPLFGDGALEVRISIGALALRLLLSCDAVDRLIPRAPRVEPPLPSVPWVSLVPTERATCTVVLGAASIAIRELMSLGVGDVIQLDQRLDEPLPLRIGPQVATWAEPGRLGRHYAVRTVPSNKV